MNDTDTGYGRNAYSSGPYGDEPKFEVTIVNTNSPVDAGGVVEVEVEVKNTGGEGTQDITLGVEEA